MTTARLAAVLLALGRREPIAERSYQAAVARSMACPECRMPTLTASAWLWTHRGIDRLPRCACGWEERRHAERAAARRPERPLSPVERLIDAVTGHRPGRAPS